MLKNDHINSNDLKNTLTIENYDKIEEIDNNCYEKKNEHEEFFNEDSSYTSETTIDTDEENENDEAEKQKELKKRFLSEEEKDLPKKEFIIPNFFTYFTFDYLNGLIFGGFRKLLEEDDISALPESDDAKLNIDLLDENWKRFYMLGILRLPVSIFVSHFAVIIFFKKIIIN
jgi:hypothetical protein